MARNEGLFDYGYAKRLVNSSVKSLIGKYGFTKEDQDDLKQDLMVHLIDRLSLYDPSRSSIHTFMTRIIENRIKSIIEYRRTMKNNCNVRQISLNHVVNGKDDDPLSLEDIISSNDCMLPDGQMPREQTDSVDIKLMVDKALQSLPSDLRTLCEQLKNKSITEIIRETGEDRNRINYKIRKIRKLLREIDFEKYL